MKKEEVEKLIGDLFSAYIGEKLVCRMQSDCMAILLYRSKSAKAEPCVELVQEGGEWELLTLPIGKQQPYSFKELMRVHPLFSRNKIKKK